MTQELLRLLMALLATALLTREAGRAAHGSRRRLAFSLGAGGFGLLAAGNLLTTLALGGQALIVGATSLGIALLLGSLVTLFLAYRAGEMSEQVRRASDYVAAERAKREALDRERLERERLERERLERETRESFAREKHESEPREGREAAKGEEL
jgi:hypothetical protein